MPHHDYEYLWQGKKQGVLANEDGDRLAPLHLERVGDHRTALLLLHGFSSSPAVYRALIPHLPPYGAVLCPVLPGHGRDLTAFSQLNAAALLSGALNAYETLAAQYEHIDVLGLSMGGLLAHQLSALVPIHHLYLLAPAFFIQGQSIPTLLLAARFLRALGIKTIKNRGGDLHSNVYSELAYQRIPLTALMTLLQMIRDEPWTTFRCPTDLFLGRHDHVVDVQKIARHFRPSDTQHLHWLENSAHILPLDADLQDMVCVIKQRWQSSLGSPN